MTTDINVDAVKHHYNKLVKLYSEANNLALDISDIKESLKAEGVDPADVCKLAKAAVKGNKDDLVTKANNFVELADILN